VCLCFFPLARQNKSDCPDFHILLEAWFAKGVDLTPLPSHICLLSGRYEKDITNCWKKQG